MVDVVRLATGGYAKIQNGVAVPISKDEADQLLGVTPAVASTAVASVPPSVTPSVMSAPSSMTTATAPITKAETPYLVGHWDGDTWIEPSGYRVARKWVDKYPALYGPLAKDPDAGQGDTECTDIIAKILAKFTGFGGTFSTWTERHAFIIFAGIGYNDVTSSADVPPVPEWALKEMAYCYSGLSMGRGAKKVEEMAPSLKTYLGSAAVGGISVGTIIQFILPYLSQHLTIAF